MSEEELAELAEVEPAFVRRAVRTGALEPSGPGGFGPRLRFLRARADDLHMVELLEQLVGGDQRHRLVAEGEPGQHGQRLPARPRPHDPVLAAVPAGQVTGDRRRDLGIVVDRQDGRFAHRVSLRESRAFREDWRTLEPAAQA